MGRFQAMDPERQKLIDKILKLLAVAGSTRFAEEAATARAMAEELRTKFNVDLTEGSKGRTRFEIEEHIPWAKGAQWEYIIAQALARLCGCEAYWQGEFILIRVAGTVADVEAWRYMIGEINNQRIKAWLEYKNSPQGSDNLWAFSFAYAKALAGKISTLLHGTPAIVEASRQAKLWFEAHNEIFHEQLIGGPGTSEAGRDAGASASLIRGRVGERRAQIGYRGQKK
jgi:hypothetical protein